MALNKTLERFLKNAINSDEVVTLLDNLLAPDISGAVQMSGALSVDSIGEYTGAAGIDIISNVDFTLGAVDISVGDLNLTLGDVVVDAGDIDVTLGDIDVAAGDINAVLGAIEAGAAITAGTGFVATTGGLLASAGDIQATVGDVVVDAGDIDVTLGDIDVAAGDINATLGAINAPAGLITAGIGLVATTGGVSASAGDIQATLVDLVLDAGSVSVTLGDIGVDAGDIDVTLGDVDVAAGNINVTLGNLNVAAGNITCGGNVDGVDVSALSGNMICVAAEDADTSSREENVAGLAESILLANAIRITMDAHAADALEHTTHIDDTNFPIVAPVATDLASLIVLVTELNVAYEAHNDDANLAAAWAYHTAQSVGNDITSPAAPTTLATAYFDIDDILTQWQAHDAHAASHAGRGSNHQEVVAAPVWGAANLFPVANVLPGDSVSWSILDSGTGTVTGVSAVAGTAGITFTFSADPQDDAIISYMAFRAV